MTEHDRARAQADRYHAAFTEGTGMPDPRPETDGTGDHVIAWAEQHGINLTDWQKAFLRDQYADRTEG
jgi:hypothetical protein